MGDDRLDKRCLQAGAVQTERLAGTLPEIPLASEQLLKLQNVGRSPHFAVYSKRTSFPGG